MHYVDRGTPPAKLKPIRKTLTPRWVSHYKFKKGRKPPDSRWREFTSDLGLVFKNLCGYCEEACKGDVDHWQPKNLYPHRAYDWSNWVFACHFCNQQKSNRWPRQGYVNPCTAIPRPESMFVFDITTTEILPSRPLSAKQRRKATQMIDDLGLNHYYHLKKRMQWITVVTKALDGARTTRARENLISYCASRERELSSITRQFFHDRGL